jgi:hypothetical protein
MDILMETDQEGDGGGRRGNPKERMPEKGTEPTEEVTGTWNEDPDFIPASRRKVPAWRTQIGLSRAHITYLPFVPYQSPSPDGI